MIKGVLMMLSLKKIIPISIVSLLLASCVDGGLKKYTTNTVPTLPSQSTLSEAEYALKLSAHLLPRVCIKGRAPLGTTDFKNIQGIKKFVFYDIFKNTADNSWYKVNFGIDFFYVNAKTIKYACGRTGWKRLSVPQGSFEPIDVDFDKVLG